MHSTYCVICRNDSWKIETVDPYLELLHSVFRFNIIDTTSCYFDEREFVTKNVLKTLSDEEEKSLVCLFGLFDHEKNTIEQIKVKNGMTDDEWQEFIAKIFRKMYHPSRRRMLEGTAPAINNNSLYVLGNQYKHDIHSKLIKEIEEVIDGSKKDTLFLKRVLKKNSIEIEVHKRLDKEIFIEDTNLTVRSFNCLKRAGIDTVNELIDLSEDELENILTQVRNLGRKGFEEIVDKLNEIKKSIGQYNSVCVVKSGEKIVYKFFDDDLEKISNEIYLEIVGNRTTIIPDSPFSPGLCELLMLKGYLFEDTVFDESEQLKSELVNFGFPEYASEIENIEKFSNMKKREENIKICFLPSGATKEEIQGIDNCKTQDELCAYVNDLNSIKEPEICNID